MEHNREIADDYKLVFDEIKRICAERDELAEALRYALWQHEGGGTPYHNHWSAKARNVLAKLECR